MSAPPTKYARFFDFTTFATTNPDKPLPGANVDVELNRIKSTTDQTIDRLNLIQRDDGKLRDGAITENSIADGAVTEPKLANLSVSTRTLRDASVTGPKIAPGSLTGAALAPGSIGPTQLADQSVTEPKLFTGAVSTRALALASVDGARIAPLAVDTPALKDFGVTNPKLGLLSVATGNLQDASVTGPKIAPASITSAHILDGSIDPADLNASTIALISSPGNPRGAWLTGTAYALKDSVTQGSGVFVAVTAHVSGVFADDLAAGKWFQTGQVFNQNLNTTDSPTFNNLTLAGAATIGGTLTAGAARFNGNVGIGRNPDPWGAGYPNLSLAAGGSIGSTPSGAIALYSNVYYDGAAYRYITAAAGGLFQTNLNVHSWFSFPAGAAGAVAALTERMRLDANGRLGIGVVPQATWVANYRTISLGPTGSIIGIEYAANANTALQLTNNSYYDGSTWRAMSGTHTCLYGLQDGAFIWYSSLTAPGAGNAFNFTERMRLDQSGQLIVAYTQNFQGDTTGAHITLQGAGGGWVTTSGFGVQATFDINGSCLSTSGNGLTMRSVSNGVILNAGASSWAAASAREYKTDIQPIPGNVFDIIRAHETALFRYQNDPEGPLRPGMFFEDAEIHFPWAAYHRLPGTRTDVHVDLQGKETITVEEIEELKSLSMEQYIPLLMEAIKRVDDRLTAGGL
jgi:hypothetical protein